MTNSPPKTPARGSSSEKGETAQSSRRRFAKRSVDAPFFSLDLELPPGPLPPPEIGADPVRRYAYKKAWARLIFSVVDAVGHSLFRGRRERPAQIRRVLLMRPDHLGDVVFSLPAIGVIRERLPDAHIDLLISPEAMPLLQNEKGPAFGVHLLPFSASWLRRPQKSRIGWGSICKLAWVLLRRRWEIGGAYDLAIDLRGDFQLIIAARIAGVRYLAGRELTGFGFWLDAKGHEEPGRHQVEGNFRLLERAGFGPVAVSNPRLSVSSPEKNQAKMFLQSHGVNTSRILIGIHPGAGAPTKKWGAMKFAGLIDRIVKEIPAQVLLLGGPSDKEDASMVAQSVNVAMLGKNIFNLAGKLPDLRAFMAVAGECALFVGNDSGPAHIAAAMGVPLVCTFSGTNRPAEWGPRGDKVVLVRKRVDCEECGLTFCDHHTCMAELDVDAVYQAVKKCVLA